MTSIATVLEDRPTRRAFRFVEPRLQIGLAGTILATTGVFCLLGAANSFAAYESLVNAALALAPVLSEHLAEQTQRYVSVTSALVTAYALAVIALSIVFVHRTVGPVVAIERHVVALKAGDYTSRIGLRAERTVFSSLAIHLNELAERMERDATAAASGWSAAIEEDAASGGDAAIEEDAATE